MVVDDYTGSGEVICTYWLKNIRKQEHFVEATLELIPPDPMPFLINPRPRPF